MSDRDQLQAAVDSRFPETLASLCDLVRIPSVSWASFPEQPVQQSAQEVAELATAIGFFDSVEVVAAETETGKGYPAVLATRSAANGKPTVLLYAHHDVQPPGQETDWNTPAFEPTLSGDRLFGRGAADDKAGIMVHIASLTALQDVLGPDTDLGVALFIEGEEESGSPSFDAFLEQFGDGLAADVIVVADSSNWDTETPALTTALRGNLVFTLTVQTLDHALHSGQFGGPTPDAATALVVLLSRLWDNTGNVTVAGLSTATLDLPQYDHDRFRKEAGVRDGVQLLGDRGILPALWAGPAVTIIGTDLPSIALASNTLQPTASARLSIRIGPGDDPEAAFEAVTNFLESVAPFGATVSFTDHDLASPFLADADGSVATLAKQTMTEAWGRQAVNQGIGGSIPFVASLVERYPSAQVLITGVEDPDTRAHSPNESLHLPGFKKAILAQALMLTRLAE